MDAAMLVAENAALAKRISELEEYLMVSDYEAQLQKDILQEGRERLSQLREENKALREEYDKLKMKPST